MGRMTGNTGSRIMAWALAGTALVTLAGCDENGQFLLGDAFNAPAGAAAASDIRTVERDVEAPDVFSATEPGLWDGRPSLGGVWVAHPDVTEPERVIIRNTANGRFVVGALFRRERDIPGPRLQVSSDAATELGMLAGAPLPLNVTALRREETSDETPKQPQQVETVAEAAPVATTPLEPAVDPIAAASAAIDAASPEPAAAPVPSPAPAAAPPAAVSRLEKPFLQVGIFSIKGNADRTAGQMRAAGMVPTILEGETGGKPFWRVIVGPAQTTGERRALLERIRATGFTDAYAVTN